MDHKKNFPAPTPKKTGVETKKELKLETEDELLARPLVSLATKRVATTRSKPRRRKGKRGAPTLPPEITTVSNTYQVLRFRVQASPSATTTIQNHQVLAAMGGIATVANSTVSSIHSTFRIRRLTIWPALGASLATSPEIVWLADTATAVKKDSSFDRSLPLGATIPEVISSVPPKWSMAGYWTEYASHNISMFSINNLTQGTIIDLHVEGTLRNNEGGVDTTGLSIATLGQMYWLYLDTTSGKLLPIGRPSTV